MSEPCRVGDTPPNGSVFINDTGETTLNSIQESSDNNAANNGTADELSLTVSRDESPISMVALHDCDKPLAGLKVDTMVTDDVPGGGDGLRQRVHFSVERPVLTQPELDEDYDGGPRQMKTTRQRLSMVRDRYRCSVECSKSMLLSFLPFIGIMKNYNIKRDIIGDVVAGLTIGIMQIPQGEY